MLEKNNIQLNVHQGVYYLPVGAVMINSSRVMQDPPALTILALAVSVNLKAATVIFGTSRNLTSSVTEATTTATFSLKQWKRISGDKYLITYYPLRSCAIFEIEIGGLLTLEEMSLLKTVYENPDPVLLARNLKSYTIEKPLEWLNVLNYLPWWEDEHKGWCFLCSSC